MEYAIATQTGDGTTALIAARADYAILVRELSVGANATNSNVTFQSGSTAISPLFSLGDKIPLVLPDSEDGWMTTTSGAALNALVDVVGGAIVTFLIGYEYRRA